MTHQFEVGKEALIEKVISGINQRIDKNDAPFCTSFAEQLLSTVGIEDLEDWNINYLSLALIHFWSTLKKRKNNKPNITIYNPSIEVDGWQSPYTVLEIVLEDEPFLVDTVRMTINRMGLASHLIMNMGGLRVGREKNGDITGVFPREGESHPDAVVEAAILIEITKTVDEKILSKLKTQLELVFKDNRAVVEDWSLMRERVRDSIDELQYAPHSLDPFEVEETQLFLKWIEDHHFTFLGVRDYELVKEDNEMVLKALPDTGLGVLRKSLSNRSKKRSLADMTPEARALTLSQHILVISKTNTLATVHRDTYTDYIGVKRFDEKGQVVGERRILGLYTSAAYNTNPKHIPFLRHKVACIMQKSRLNPRSHAGKVLLNILETMPRDDLIQGLEDELLEISMGIFHLQERRRIRLFARMDVYRRFVSCLVYIPRDIFNTDLRKLMQNVLGETFQTNEIKFSTYFSESILARIHFIIRLNPGDKKHYDFSAIEKRLIEVGRSWKDDLQYLLKQTFEEEKATSYFLKYKNAFSTSYTSRFAPKVAIDDITYLEALTDENPLGMHLYQQRDAGPNYFQLKLYQNDFTLVLSDVLPILECLGMRAVSERPYAIKFDTEEAQVNEFIIEYTGTEALDLKSHRLSFQEAFKRVWFKEAENDGFNRLILAAGLDWRQVAILRTYAKYFKQIRFPYSQDYIEIALAKHPEIVEKIVQLFEVRFRPGNVALRGRKVGSLRKEILQLLESVSNLAEDKIIRQFVQVIMSTLRTNYYQKAQDGSYKNYIAIKIDSRSIPGLPRPYPMFEIFVYSPRFEGIHLRSSKVARGGLRWSDRPEDFRTEILGLMKAQQVKNAVIVPSGAKGGFVTKELQEGASREDVQAEGVFCYKEFIRALLDITDNHTKEGLVKPEDVVCYDEDDPYLVVAADKGTATFSDIANHISKSYGFWLGDAFASGGSVGYDHKKMGITARGAWESVKRHFYEVGTDIMNQDFTVVGIGDMAGDVFGNGMLLSKHIRLVAAFNHMHIFIDPNPDAQESYKERKRLFNLSRSTWADYQSKLISKGGGVFSRTDKSIRVSREMKALFDITQDSIEPNELIQAVLTAKVDLLWSGGVGTFVKASSESHFDVGDRTNDALRVDASKLRCRVVGEGGNLGLTQLARVEYALKGGLIYTDFIDNSAGVNCSDKEVNIKILLNSLVENKSLTEKKRNALLAAMTDEVAELVLRDNILQTRTISLMTSQAARSIDLNSRYLNALEQEGKLDRALEFLPSKKTLTERKSKGKGLTGPEISVLVCYSKIQLEEAILHSDIPEDKYLLPQLKQSLPKLLQEKFSDEIITHPLRREIISTRISNIIVNEVGFSFVYRLHDETGAPVPAIVRAYLITRAIFNMDAMFRQIEALGTSIKASHQSEILVNCIRLLRRTTRWFLRFKRTHLDMVEMIERYADGITVLKRNLATILTDAQKEVFTAQSAHYEALGLPVKMAQELAANRTLFFAMDMVEIAEDTKVDIKTVGRLYYKLGEFLDLTWVRTQLVEHPTDNHWEALSREALRDDIDWQQRKLTTAILQTNLDEWSTLHEPLVARWKQMVGSLRSSSTLSYTMFFVAIRELLDLTETTIQDVVKK